MRDRVVLEPTFDQYVIPRDFKKFPIKVGGCEGVATNNADYVTQAWEFLPNGKQKLVWRCPAYRSWKSTIERGYSQKYKERFPTYQNVTVCDEWLLFSNFRSWWIENNVAGWHLDKDLLVKGNIIYSPDTCVYVPNYLNKLLLDHAAARGNYPLGVYRTDKLKPYRSQCSVGGEKKRLGYFPTPQEAHRTWQIAKINSIEEAITRYTEDANNLGVFDQRVVAALEERIFILQDDVDNGRQTFVLH